MAENLTTNPVTCPDCKNRFLQPFVCTTCGAQKLYDETVRSQAATIDRLTRDLAMWSQVWDNVKLDNPNLREDNKPLAVAACYGLLKLEADRMREALVMSVNAMREPFDGWKREVEALALAAARAVLKEPT